MDFLFRVQITKPYDFLCNIAKPGAETIARGILMHAMYSIYPIPIRFHSVHLILAVLYSTKCFLCRPVLFNWRFITFLIECIRSLVNMNINKNEVS